VCHRQSSAGLVCHRQSSAGLVCHRQSSNNKNNTGENNSSKIILYLTLANSLKEAITVDDQKIRN